MFCKEWKVEKTASSSFCWVFELECLKKIGTSSHLFSRVVLTWVFLHFSGKVISRRVNCALPAAVKPLAAPSPHLWLQQYDSLFSFPTVSPGLRWDQPVLLVPVWWTCWVRRSCGRFQTAAAPHPGAAAGDCGHPEEHGCSPTHLPGRGTWQHIHQQQDADTGSLPAGWCGGPGLTQHPPNTLLHWEEDPTWVPGYWGYRKCIQGNGMYIFRFWSPHFICSSVTWPGQNKQ